jgi:putative methyltransferase (TIGR04325 family)
MIVAGARSLLKKAASHPLARALRKREYDKEFAGDCFGCNRGVFRSFAEAAATAPKTKRFGFDLPEFARADIFSDRLTGIFPYDYPVLFWLKSLLAPGATIFDLGGHVGIHFYAYAPYLVYPPGMRWIVCDVAEVATVGARMAASRSAEALTFTTRVADADGADVLVSAGALQFVESPPLATTLGGLARRPSHLLLNKLPLYDGDSFVTLQNGGPHFIAQHIFNRDAFISAITSVGYRLMDAWADPMHSCFVPFHPERSVPVYSGLYFRAER